MQYKKNEICDINLYVRSDSMARSQAITIFRARLEVALQRMKKEPPFPKKRRL